MFDPEKVERIYAQTLNDDCRFKQYVVLAEDYDYLLALWRAGAVEREIKKAFSR